MTKPPPEHLQEAFQSFERAAAVLEHGHYVLHDRVRQLEDEERRRRLEALGHMAAEIAHEVRNPLGSIRLFCEMLLDDLENEDSRAMVDHVLDATAGLEATVDNLLSFASPTAAKSRTFDVAALARDVCDFLAPSCAIHGTEVTAPPPDARVDIDGEPEAIRQVVLNLTANAVHATRDAGHAIEVSVTPDTNRSEVVLSVADDGAGMSADVVARMFDPFFTRSGNGTGLGLSIVHGIVERHRGKIHVDSEIGQGTRVRVHLPIATLTKRPSAEDT